MPHPPRSRIVSLATGTAVATGVGMIPLHRLPSAVQISYVVLPAAAGAGISLAALRRAGSRTTEDGEQETRRGVFPSAVRATLPLMVGGIIAGSSVASIWLDRGLEGLLRRRGVPAPRVAMGLASGALSLAMAALEPRDSDQPAEVTSAPSAP